MSFTDIRQHLVRMPDGYPIPDRSDTPNWVRWSSNRHPNTGQTGYLTDVLKTSLHRPGRISYVSHNRLLFSIRYGLQRATQRWECVFYMSCTPRTIPIPPALSQCVSITEVWKQKNISVGVFILLTNIHEICNEFSCDENWVYFHWVLLTKIEVK